ncbi:hypothetical protein AB6A40_002886 [Gnathostoma spinigerum]|uniref:Beta-galactosidase n=1 Tax=Gnathostoma spinigerum TaxID=75299 RepID=A0ABD6EHX9_9BILA
MYGFCSIQLIFLTMMKLLNIELTNALETSSKSFSIDYNNNTFLLDGSPFRYISGSIHYFRIHRGYWKDRLRRISALGLNAIQFYIPWNFHEIQRGTYNFEGNHDVEYFIQLAQQENLYVLLRLGPYVCGEWENGGLPYWLNLDRRVVLRSSNPYFMSEVRRWFRVLLPKLVKHLRKNGGPILMVQIENEYGSYGCDKVYLRELSAIVRSVFGPDVVQYTTDGNSARLIECGSISEAYPTVDFGPTTSSDVDSAFALQRAYAPKGPLVNSEFYPGWFTLWGQKHQDLPTDDEVISTIRYMYTYGASFNIYMLHGGTNFGFWNGAEEDAPVITSYDYSAPINEAGDTTAQYLAIRNFMKEKGWKPKDVPADNPKSSYGLVRMHKMDTLLEGLRGALVASACATSDNPLSFEELSQALGFVYYQTTLEFGGKYLTIPGFSDYGYVYLGDTYQGMLADHFYNISKRSISLAAYKGAKLAILVENAGRLTYPVKKDFKGIFSQVFLDGRPVVGWRQCGVDDKVLSRLYAKESRRNFNQIRNTINWAKKENGRIRGPGVFMGAFSAEDAADTFVDMRGWGKGIIFINGFHLGRYWSYVGPQLTLYVPAVILRKENTIMLVELNASGNCDLSTCYLTLNNEPLFNFTSV